MSGFVYPLLATDSYRTSGRSHPTLVPTSSNSHIAADGKRRSAFCAAFPKPLFAGNNANMGGRAIEFS